MCYMLYLGSVNSLPTVPIPDWNLIDFAANGWLEQVPRLVVTELKEYNEKARYQFTEPNVVNAGSYEGCGCGFNYCAYVASEDLTTLQRS